MLEDQIETLQLKRRCLRLNQESLLYKAFDDAFL